MPLPFIVLKLALSAVNEGCSSDLFEYVDFFFKNNFLLKRAGETFKNTTLQIKKFHAIMLGIDLLDASMYPVELFSLASF